MSKIAALVLAAGKCSRMKSECPKQFIEICGKPVVAYSLLEFEKCSKIQEIVLVTGQDDIAYCQKEIVERFGLRKVKKIVAGGTQRYWSVWNGLQEVSDSDYVLIHDGARPMITQQIIEDSIEEVVRTNACTVGVPVKDTIKIVDGNGMGIDTPDRNTLWQIQTPQSFRVELLIAAYNKMREEKCVNITDDTMIMEQFSGVKSKVIMGDYRNIKLTTPEDLFVAEKFLKNF